MRAGGERIEARVLREQMGLFQLAAVLQNRTLADFVVSSLRDSALRTLQELAAVRRDLTDSGVSARTSPTPRELIRIVRSAANRLAPGKQRRRRTNG